MRSSFLATTESTDAEIQTSIILSIWLKVMSDLNKLLSFIVSKVSKIRHFWQ